MKGSLTLTFVASIIFGIAGCKPKEASLSGQIFVVTRNAENIKMGDIEVSLLEKEPVVNFFEKRSLELNKVLEIKQTAVTNAERSFEFASQNLKNDRESLNSLNKAEVYRTNAIYVELNQKWESLFKSYLIQSNKVQELYALQSFQVDDVFSAAVKKKQEIALELDSISAEVEKIKIDATKAAVQKLAASTHEYSDAKLILDAASRDLESYPDITDYLRGFSPVAYKKVRSDADGKFLLKYSGDKAFTIFVKAKRTFFGKTEQYFWLVNAPASPEESPLILSNNNDVNNDPDGYFKIKIKSVALSASEENLQ